MLRPRRCRSCFRDRCSQLVSACLPKDLRFVIYDLRAHGGGVVLLTRKSSFVNRKSKLAARVGLAPTPCGLTNRRATLTPPGNGAAGRISTCIVPFRRRMPHVFEPRQQKSWIDGYLNEWMVGASRLCFASIHISNHPFIHSKTGQRGRNCTCGPPVPGRACCCYTTR